MDFRLCTGVSIRIPQHSVCMVRRQDLLTIRFPWLGPIAIIDYLGVTCASNPVFFSFSSPYYHFLIQVKHMPVFLKVPIL